ncbi:MAG TPA: cellulase family glycosylhydrolase [Catenuloplanes sp.]|jgi:mannan endo-1,4-beta-mannosidase
MKSRLLAIGAVLIALVASVLIAVQPAHAAVGFTVSGGRLLDANGNNFVMRGVSHAHVWFPSQTSSFANIASLGANSVRVALSSGKQWTKNEAADVANVVSLCKQHRLICVLEVHDTTGYGEAGAAASLAEAVDYWLSIRSALVGQENYVIINIGNEPHGNTGFANWTADTSNAITRLRAAGLQHTLMVDAPNWGQDWTFTMRDNAARVFASDPARNTVFSVHMYGVFDTAAEITDYLGRFRAAGLPIVVGEFGHNHSDGNPDEDTIMSYTQANGIGWLGWSWSGNGGGVEYLDMVTGFNVNSLTSWGQRIFNGANGIRQTSRIASVYPPVGPTSPGPSSPGPSSPGPSSPPPIGGSRTCTASYTVVGHWQGGFQGELKITAGAAPITGWTVAWTFAAGERVSQSWNAAVTSSGAGVSASNVGHNGAIPAGGSTSFGFIGSRTGTTNSAPTVICTAR